MHFVRPLLIVAALLICAMFAGAADWPQLNGPNGDRTAPDTGLNADWTAHPPTQLWQYRFFLNGYAGPCVMDGVIYIVDHTGQDDILRALDMKEGKELWHVSYPETLFDDYGATNCTPTYDNGMLYILARDGQVLCIDVKTHTIVWKVDMQKDMGAFLWAYQYDASITVDGDNVLVQPGGKGIAVAVLNKLTGKTVWIGGGDDTPGYAPVLVASFNGVKQYICVGGKTTFAVAPETGKVLWSIPSSHTYMCSNVMMPMVVGANRLFISSDGGMPSALYEINADGPKQVWMNSNIVSNSSQPICVDGKIYGTDNKANLVCEDVGTGKVLWSQPGFPEGGLLAVDGKLIVLDGKSGAMTLVKLTPDSYQSLGSIPGLGGKSLSGPVVADGLLIVRNERTLAAYKLK